VEFLFGTFATDELKLIHHRAARRGLQHRFEIRPRDPLPAQPIRLVVWVGADVSADHVACYFTADGSEPRGAFGQAQSGQVVRLERVDVAWDMLTWGYGERWEGTLPPQAEGAVLRYRIGAWAEGGQELFADWPQEKRVVERAARAFFANEPIPETTPAPPDEGTVFDVHIDRLQPPEWARQALIYHVFVDRFYPGDGRAWQQPDALSGFYGGTLWGVRDKLDYIAELGATCIWLSPTWPSPSHHGYDVTDYGRVEPRLGGDEALRVLVEAAHARGIRVLLDLVCNHISREHPIFQEALRDPQSPYRAWFTFDAREPHGYRSFFGVREMPKLNLAHPEARAWMLEIARYWLREFDVDGYRLDHAAGPGPGFWSDFRAACRAEKADAFCFGELIDQPTSLLPYIGRLDGALDFQIAEALRKTYARGEWSEADLERFLARHEAFWADEGDFVRLAFIDNHDMDRFLYAAGGDVGALRRALERLLALPHPLVLYYGTEVGLSQRWSTRDGRGLEVAREPMRWGDAQNHELLAVYRTLAARRAARGSIE